MSSGILGFAVGGILKRYSKMKTYINRRLEVAAYTGSQTVHGGGVILGGKRIL